MGYDKFAQEKGVDESVINNIVDYAYKNFDVWYPQEDVAYFHELRYEDKILDVDRTLEYLADHIYEEEDFIRNLGLDIEKEVLYNWIALDPVISKEIGRKLIDRFYKASEGTVSKEATEYTEEEKAYMEYLDDLYPDVPVSYGLLLYKGDPIAFQLGMQDWLSKPGE